MTTLDALEAWFERTSAPEDYVRIRDEARRCPDGDALQAAMLAADCSYGIVVAAAHGANAAADLLADMARAATLLAAAMPDTPLPQINRFASLARDLCNLGGYGSRDGWVDEVRWTAITTGIETALPVDFAFAPSIFGVEAQARTVDATGTFAALSCLRGSVEIGSARYRHLLDVQYRAGDPVAYYVTAYRVRDELARCTAANPLAFTATLNIPVAVIRHLNQFRQKWWSRAGRVLVSELFTPLIDQFVVDLADPVLPEAWQGAGAAQEAFHQMLRERLVWVAEHGRSRLLLDQLSGCPLPLMSSDEARRLLALPPRAPEGPEGMDARLVARLPAVFWQDARLAPVAAEFRARLARTAALEGPPPEGLAGLDWHGEVAELGDLQAALRPGEALVILLLPRETLHPARRICTIAITAAWTRHILTDLEVLKSVPGLYHGDIGTVGVGGQEPLEVSPLAELVVSLRAAIRDDSPLATPLLRLLHIVLVAPLEQIGITPAAFGHWFVVASGPLHAVPLGAALGKDGRYLAQDVALSFPPSASTWLAARAAWDPPQRFAGLANPVLDRARWRALPYAAQEIEGAARRLAPLPTGLHIGPDATMAALRAEAAAASVLHVATHGDFPEADVIDLHQVLLTPDTTDDGVVTAEWLRTLKLDRVQLLVLSVCNGGLLRFGAGEELYGLLPAALCAGAANLLTTLWPIDDGMASVWMQAFYKTLVALGPARAAQLAASSLIEDGAAVRDWAPFVLIGATGHPEMALPS